MSDESLQPQPNWTAQRASEFGVQAQQPGESFNAFRHRVSAAIHAQGHIIEAHEAMSNALYDDPTGDPMTKIIGSVAQAMEDRNYGSTRDQQVGDDIAAGYLIQNPRPENNMAAEMAILMIQLLGNSR